MDEDGRVLLSRRGDLGVWNLPGGRLDADELLEQAAVREVREETGIVAHVERAVGLYYLGGWRRLNVLYAGFAVGGELQARTDETRDNRFFSPDDLPPDLWQPVLTLDALAETRHKPRAIETDAGELRKIRARLAWRWLKNLLAGRREPKFPRYHIEAVATIWDDAHRRIVVLHEGQGLKLPSVICTGEYAPWEELAAFVQAQCGISVEFRWVGMGDSVTDKWFVFAATIREDDLRGQAEWSLARNAALGLDARFVEQVKPTYATDPVWTIYEPEPPY